MPFDVILISDVSIDEFLKVDDASVVCDIDKKNCKICLNYAEKIPVSEFKTSLGGNSANVAAGLAKLGLNVSVYSEIGSDGNGDRFKRELESRGVDTSLLVRGNKETDVHSIIVYQGERTILSYHGPKDYKVQNWKKPKWMYYSSLPKNFEAFQEELIKYLKENPSVLVAFNPGVYHFAAGYEKYRSFLEITDLLFVNKEEAIKIVRQSGLIPSDNLLELHKQLSSLGVKMCVITNAESGASVYDGSSFENTHAYETNLPVVDKTGAGDAFASGFLSAIVYGKRIREALCWGAVNSSKCIREIGPMNGLIGKTEMELLVKDL